MPDFPALAAMRNTIARYAGTASAPAAPARRDIIWPEPARENIAEPAAPAAVSAPEAASEPEEKPEFPPGVLGYAVAVYPGGGPRCTGLTHAGIMTEESARREARQHLTAARDCPASGGHPGYAYRLVEIREVP